MDRQRIVKRKDERENQLVYNSKLDEDIIRYSLRLRLVIGLLFRLEELETLVCNLHNFNRRNVGPDTVFPDLFMKM